LLTPEIVNDEILRRGSPEYPLNVYWVTVLSDRNDFANELKLLEPNVPIVSYVLRKQGMFADPNTVMNDVVSVLDEVRDEVVQEKEVVSSGEALALVVLSRTEWKLAITSSPILLPEWFPAMPLQSVTARIEDLTWTARVSLRDSVLAIEEVHRLLYDVEVALVNRVQRSLAADHRLVQALWADIERERKVSVAEGLRQARVYLQGVRNPTSFRPSTRGPTIIGRIWYKASSTAPEGLAKTAKALASALALEETEGFEDPPLVGVLNRPMNRIGVKRYSWSFNLVLALRSACQLVTAAAHADEYPPYSVFLLRSTIEDLRRFLDSAAALLQD